MRVAWVGLVLAAACEATRAELRDDLPMALRFRTLLQRLGRGARELLGQHGEPLVLGLPA